MIMFQFLQSFVMIQFFDEFFLWVSKEEECGDEFFLRVPEIFWDMKTVGFQFKVLRRHDQVLVSTIFWS